MSNKSQLRESIVKQVGSREISEVQKSVRALYRIYLKNKTKNQLIGLLMDEWDQQSKSSDMEDFIDQATEIQFSLMFGSLPVGPKE